MLGNYLVLEIGSLTDTRSEYSDDCRIIFTLDTLEPTLFPFLLIS
jgi:hypothetical protein